jgi:hypothetical protein
LKARGPKVDKVPPLRLDLDFMDTSGYVVLPVESAALPVDATPTKGSARPFEKLQITQTLDERQAADGKLILEVKATARGLVPDLENIVALDHPGFQIDKVDDQGISVSRFDPDSDASLIDSERTWLVAFRAAEGQEKPPATFRFGKSTVDGAEFVYQRYVDADLAKVGPEISLEATYDRPRYAWLGWAGGGLLALAVVAAAIWKLRSVPKRVAVQRFEMPKLVTPFSVLGLLREIQHNNGFSAPQTQELAGSIELIERHFFTESDGDSIDLRQVAETWIRRAT